jgi:outer membrane protein OmpA-like peptidoglycan-associated protein
MDMKADESTDEKGLLAFFALAIVPVLLLVVLFGRIGDRSISTALPPKPSVLGTSETVAATVEVTAPTTTVPATAAPTTTVPTTTVPTTTAAASTTLATTPRTTARPPSTTSRSTVASTSTTSAAQSSTASVQFASGSAALTDSARATLATVATKIRSLPNGTRVTLTGVADNRGDAAANSKLSSERANTVKAALVALGAKNAAYDIVAKGEEVGADLDKARRVDIVIAAV